MRKLKASHIYQCAVLLSNLEKNLKSKIYLTDTGINVLYVYS